MIMIVRPKYLLELDEDKWQEYYVLIRVMVMMFSATFNNISVICGGSVLLVEKTTNLPQVTKVNQKVVSSTPLHFSGDRH